MQRISVRLLRRLTARMYTGGMKERFWDHYQSWEEAEEAWDAAAAAAANAMPLKAPDFYPSSHPIAPKEGSMRWKGFRWVIRRDGGCRLFRLLIRHPIKYICQFFSSLVQDKAYHKEGDFFFYGVGSVEELYALMKRDDTLLIVGFSYCQKPHECPCARFSNGCSAEIGNPVCQQCAIAKVMHALPHGKTIPIVIPTINDIGNHVLEVIDAFPHHRVLFMITACEMALEMFGDLGNMVGIQGVGIRLGGRTCNTMRAFALSEEGVKPGLTKVLPPAERRMLDLLRFWRQERLQETGCPQVKTEGCDCCQSPLS